MAQDVINDMSQACSIADRAPSLEDNQAIADVVKGRVVVAMSGGVDSSVAAAMLAKQGFDAVGISMRLYSTPPESFSKSCCSPDDLFDARAVADSLSIPFYVANYEEAFRERVIDYFVEEYKRGRTPNPCVACNDHLKFDILLKRSLALGAKYLATGHFARIDRSGDEPRLLRGLDRSKDQSYFLFGLPREALGRILFPLGELTKEEVRMVAREMGLETAEKPESQEICFVGGNDYKDFVAKLISEQEKTPGQIVTETGEVLGEHDGIHQFTVGQRRGLGLSYHHPLYVKAIRPEDGTVIVGGKDSLWARGFTVDRCNWLAFERPPKTMRCSVKIRYAGEPVPALLSVGDDPTTAFVEFQDPQRAVTPGQVAVLYRGEEVLGGGWIKEARA